MSDNGSDAFLTKVRDRLTTLAREDALLAAQEDGVRRKRGELQQSMVELRQSMQIYQDLMEVADTTAPGQMSAVPEPSGKIADLIANYLAQHGGRGRVTELAHWLVDIGRLPKGTDKYGSNYGTTYTALIRDARFQKVGRGEWIMSGSGSRLPASSG